MSEPWLLLDPPTSAETAPVRTSVASAQGDPQPPRRRAWPQAAVHERWASVLADAPIGDPRAGAWTALARADDDGPWRPWPVTAWQHDRPQPGQGAPWAALHRLSARPPADWRVGLLLMQPLWRLGEAPPEDDPAPPDGLRAALRLRWQQPAPVALLALPAEGLDAALLVAAAHLCVGLAAAAAFMPHGRPLWRAWLQGCCRPWDGASLLWDADDILHYLRAEALSPP